jgi:hypothetical protein
MKTIILRCLLSLSLFISFLPSYQIEAAAAARLQLEDTYWANTLEVQFQNIDEQSPGIEMSGEISTTIGAFDLGILPGAELQPADTAEESQSVNIAEDTAPGRISPGSEPLLSAAEITAEEMLQVVIDATELGVSQDASPISVVIEDTRLLFNDEEFVETGVTPGTIPQAGEALMPRLFLPAIQSFSANASQSTDLQDIPASELGIPPGSEPLLSTAEISTEEMLEVVIDATELGVLQGTSPINAVLENDPLLQFNDEESVETGIPTGTIPQAGETLLPRMFLPAIQSSGANANQSEEAVSTTNPNSETSAEAVVSSVQEMLAPESISSNVSMSSVRTTDRSNNAKTSFNAGENLRYGAYIANSTGATRTVNTVWSLSTPCGSSTIYSGNVNTGTGTQYWYIDGTAPSNCPGSYTLTVRATYNGQSTSKTSTFTVNGGGGNVSMSSVRTTDRSNNAKTSFNAGENLRYGAYIANSTGATRTVNTVWSLATPCGSSTLYSGNLTTGTGTQYWTLDGTAASNCPGSYTFTVRVTYNGQTTSKSSSFSVSCSDCGGGVLDQTVTLSNGTQVKVRDLPGNIPVDILTDDCGKPGQFPFDGQTRCLGNVMPTPPVQNSSGSRNPDIYKAVIDQFGTNPDQPRYSKDDYTYCNTFAGDVMRAMGVPLPKKSSIDPATIAAAPLYKWFTDGSAAQEGWSEINASTSDGLQRLIAHVNSGKPAIATVSTHIAVIRPGQSSSITSYRDLRIAQAGATNSHDIALSTGFGGTTANVKFYVNE